MTPNHNPKYQLLLKRLRAARRAAGFTQEQAGEAVGQNQSYISKVETNHLTLDPIELLELAAAYRVDVRALLDFDDEP